MYAKGNRDQGKAIHFESTSSTSKPDSFYYFRSPTRQIQYTSGMELERVTWTNLLSGVTRYISEVGDIFVTDKSVGSHRLGQVNLRIISPDPNASLYLNTLLNSSPGNVDTFKHQVILYHAPGYYPSKETGVDDHSLTFTVVSGQDLLNLLNPQQFKEMKDAEAVSKEEGVVIFLTGDLSMNKLRDAILTASDYINLREGRVPLDASVITHKNGKSALVFDPTESLTQGRIHSGLFSVGHSVWKDGYLYRSFNGVTHSNSNLPRKLGDIVEKGKNKSSITQAHTSKESYASNPSALLFLVNDRTSKLPAVGKVATTDAIKLWQQGFIDGTNFTPYYRNRPIVEPKKDAYVSAFQQFLNSNSSLPVYLVKVGDQAGPQTKEKLDTTLNSIFDEKANFPSIDINTILKK
jgi:hypothetical protein